MAGDLHFKIHRQRPADRATVIAAKAGPTISIISHTRIGSATLSRTAKDWPAVLMVQLQLQSLESLKVGNGEIYFTTFLENREPVQCYRVEQRNRLVDTIEIPVAKLDGVIRFATLAGSLPKSKRDPDRIDRRMSRTPEEERHQP